MRLVRALIAFWLALAAVAVQAEEGGRFVDMPAFPSRHIAAPHVIIWLPPGYDSGARRYPVVYMHDAENLFFLAQSNFNKVWAADKSAMRLAAAKRVPPFIIVGIYSPKKDRARTYMPARVYGALPPAMQRTLQPWLGGPVVSDGYLRFIVDELKPMVDRTYRTRGDRAHTAIVGSSMGGLISFYAISEYPKIFGMAGCVSTHWPLGDPALLPEARAEILKVWANHVKQRLKQPDGRRIWFDHGTETLDSAYAPYQEAIDADLIKAGWRKGLDFASTTYPGAAHEENAWAARMDDIFVWLLGRMP